MPSRSLIPPPRLSTIIFIQPCHPNLGIGYRYVHTTPRHKSASASTASPPHALNHDIRLSAMPKTLPTNPLSILPTSQILRTYLITRATSTPFLLRTSLSFLSHMLSPNARLLSPSHNPLLRWIFKRTFYAQFCAGENAHEIHRTIASVKEQGYAGVILEYALELLPAPANAPPVSDEQVATEIRTWREGMLSTISMASSGDFVALKWSGLGQAAMALLDAAQPPTDAMRKAMEEVCRAARDKGVSILPSAEHAKTNAGGDEWTMGLQRVFNKALGGRRPVVYTTYQAYLKSAASRITRDLEIAQKEGFTLGIKLVRGAYLASEERGAIWENKEGTDAAYDGIMEAVLRRFNGILEGSGEFPNVALVIASHNLTSIQKARAIRDSQISNGEKPIECAYAQLQGMADEISCELVKVSREGKTTQNTQHYEHGDKQQIKKVDIPSTYKCATWGTVPQCLQFLYRRAAENQDAAGRTVETRRAMGRELFRRLGFSNS